MEEDEDEGSNAEAAATATDEEAEVPIEPMLFLRSLRYEDMGSETGPGVEVGEMECGREEEP